MRAGPFFVVMMIAACLGGCGAFAPMAPSALNAPAPAVVSAELRPGLGPVPAALPIRFGGPDSSYTLDSGDKLRITVFGQDGITNSYIVDAGGNVTMPLIGSVPARGITIRALSDAISGRLQAGFIREPHVAVEIESYRPFFILGEVTLPGQYPFVPGMTAETAVAIAGGFTPRARRGPVEISRPVPGGVLRVPAPLTTLVRPGDTITVDERWF